MCYLSHTAADITEADNTHSFSCEFIEGAETIAEIDALRPFATVYRLSVAGYIINDVQKVGENKLRNRVGRVSRDICRCC